MKKADNKDEKLNMNLSWKILDETTVIKDSWIDMRASTCQLPGGMVIAPFYVNHLPDFAVVVAVTPEHRVIMVRQYRHGVEKVLLELPAGCIEAGEDPKDGAARELLEETGYKAGSLEFLFKITRMPATAPAMPSATWPGMYSRPQPRTWTRQRPWR